MFALFGVPGLLQIAVPVALLTWQIAGREPDLASWLLKTIAVAAYLAAIAVAGLWLIAPWYLPLVFGGAAGCLAIFRLQSLQSVWPPHEGRWWIPFCIHTTAATVAIALLVGVLQGRRVPDESVIDLQFPLIDGTYYIANGGSTELLNAHVALRAPRFQNFRGQSYGLDIVKLGPLGLRASRLAPTDPTQYQIFGDAVYAPCGGVVLRAENAQKDLSPPEVDRTQMAGNHVLLQCGEFQVLLGHLRHGSVRVRQHDQVGIGTLLGEVGNSGNSNEPHLHIGTQRPATGGQWFSGDPLPVRLDGRYLVRNDRVEALRHHTKLSSGPSDAILED